MISKSTNFYNLRFFDNYVIAEANEGAVIGNEEVKESLEMIFNHYNGKEFTLISNRRNNYSLNIDVYTLRLMKRLKALAVVSNDNLVREKAISEQSHFDQSFAFFTELDDAIGWAESVFTP